CLTIVGVAEARAVLQIATARPDLTLRCGCLVGVATTATTTRVLLRHHLARGLGRLRGSCRGCRGLRIATTTLATTRVLLRGDRLRLCSLGLRVATTPLAA